MKKSENDQNLAREATARQDILKKVNDYQGHSKKVGDYQNQVSLPAESELTDSNEEYYNGKDETLKNRIKLKNQKEKGTNVKSRPDPTTKSQSDGSKSLSDDYKPFKARHKPLVDYEPEAKRTFLCNTNFDFFNLVDPWSDSSERDSEGTFLKYRVYNLKVVLLCLINFC